MGVKDLWKLLEPAGRPVNLESLEGLVVGVGKFYIIISSTFNYLSQVHDGVHLRSYTYTNLFIS